MALAQVGTEMVVPTVVGLLLDLKFGWTPWGLLVGVILGLVGGFYHMIAILKRLNQRDE
jgi:F0F1-type ATP synthase assembly protein I